MTHKALIVGHTHTNTLHRLEATYYAASEARASEAISEANQAITKIKTKSIPLPVSTF